MIDGYDCHWLAADAILPGEHMAVTELNCGDISAPDLTGQDWSVQTFFIKTVVFYANVLEIQRSKVRQPGNIRLLRYEECVGGGGGQGEQDNGEGWCVEYFILFYV